MKRRDFLLSLTSSTSLLYLKSARAARPCPPTLSGTSEATCSAIDAEIDWQSRISGPGVVWYHNFENDAEVDNFRWASGYGNDQVDAILPGLCNRNTSDGITGGGCLELVYPVGSQNAPGWWRPLAPMSALSSGKSVDDPAADGSISLASWDASNIRENEAFREAYYAHPDYVGVDGFDASKFNGHEFWLQFRIKVSASRFDNVIGGKYSFLATTQQTLNQEIVQENGQSRLAFWYTNFGSSPDTGGSMGVSSGTKQPGGDYNACDRYNPSTCWQYADDEWVTFLYHLVPGHHLTKDTLFEVFAAREGQTEYETIFTQLNTIKFSPTSTGHPFGWNSFQPSNYMNGQAATTEWTQRYDEIIFSKEFIPCPQV